MAPVFTEAIVVGVATMVVGSLVGYILSDYHKARTGKSWGVEPMLTSLFLTGVVVHRLTGFPTIFSS